MNYPLLTMTDKRIELTDKHFIDWESQIFGYGYGTGELPILRCLHFFFSSLEDGRRYDYEVLEKELGDAATWFLINALCHAGVIEYGTSPRYAWIDSTNPAISALRDYIVTRTPEQLYEIVANRPDEYIHCYPDYCNCAVPCNNPLFAR